MKVTGLDSFAKEIKDASKALEGLDGELGSVSFDPHDPASIETAIKKMELMVDTKLGRHANNSIIAPLIEGMKEKYRAGLLERAAAARLGQEKKE